MYSVVLIIVLFLGQHAYARESIVVGSKIFTESYILAEIASQQIESSTHEQVIRKFGMGGTGMLYESIRTGAIDIYPEYTGTLIETVLKEKTSASFVEIREHLKPLGLDVSDSLGFDNGYAIAVRKDFAEKHHLQYVGDLRKIQNDVQLAFSYEFMERNDGYDGLVHTYELEFPKINVRQMEHSLVYKAIKNGDVDVVEVYSTDANVEKMDLVLLDDDRNYFTKYQAVWIARHDFIRKHPQAWSSLTSLCGKLNGDSVRRMNMQADIEKKRLGSIASLFLKIPESNAEKMFSEVFRRTYEHLCLVGIGFLFSLCVGVPLGILAGYVDFLGRMILLVVSFVQTIPALALLCFLIPMFGIGLTPALIALCLYGLLPVVSNTYMGIRTIDAKHIENGKAFGLTPFYLLTRVVIPLASPSIIAGLKISMIVSIGTATLAALIGAGGYGALIVSGLSLNDTPMILWGALPAALMALVANVLSDGIAWWLIPRGLSKRL